MLRKKRSDQGAMLWVILVILLVGGIIAGTSLFMSTQKVKNSSDYAACQRALNNADAGADRVVYALLHTPDSNNDGIYNDSPPSTSDTWGTKIYDVDNNGTNDFWQLFGLNQNVPNVTNVAESNALELFITSDDEAYVWIDSSAPSPNQATIYSKSVAGGCTKMIKVIVSAVAGSPGSGVNAPLYNAP